MEIGSTHFKVFSSLQKYWSESWLKNQIFYLILQAENKDLSLKSLYCVSRKYYTQISNKWVGLNKRVGYKIHPIRSIVESRFDKGLNLQNHTHKKFQKNIS